MRDDGAQRGRGRDLQACYQDADIFTSQSRFEFARGEEHAHETVQRDDA